MRLRTFLKIAIIVLSTFFSLPSIAKAQRDVIKQITDTLAGSSGSPSISSDGTKVVFSSNGDFAGSNSDHNQEIFLYDIAGGKFTQITNTTGFDPFDPPTNSSPSISAEGNKIVFESTADFIGSNRDRTSEIFLATIQESFPYVLLSTSETTLRTGASLRLDLILQPGKSSFHIDIFFSIETGLRTLYLASDLSFVPNRVAVASNFLLRSDMPDLKARIFGPRPSVIGEVIIPRDVSGSFTFKVEIINSQTGESLGSNKVTFLILAPLL